MLRFQFLQMCIKIKILNIPAGLAFFNGGTKSGYTGTNNLAGVSVSPFHSTCLNKRLTYSPDPQNSRWRTAGPF